MRKPFRSIAAILLAASLAALCTACGNSSSSADDTPASTRADRSERSIYVPEVPETPISEDVPGVDLNAEIGETVQYEDKLDITLNQVVEVDDVNKTLYRVLLAEITISNKSAEKIDCSTLTHFSMEIDGEEKISAVRDVQAAVVGRKYYTAIGSSLQAFNQEIPAGETLTGYVYIYAPSAWKEMKLIYIPYKYFSNDTVIFNLDEGKFVHYSDPLPTD